MSGYKATGGCHCGGVKFEMTMPLSQVHKCHCSMCRKTIGSDYATFGPVPKTHFKVLKKDTLKEYVSSETLTRCFCGVCGCSVFGIAPDQEIKVIFVNLGSLDVDKDPGLKITFQIFASDKAPWVKIDPEIPACDAWELYDLDALKK